MYTVFLTCLGQRWMVVDSCAGGPANAKKQARAKVNGICRTKRAARVVSVRTSTPEEILERLMIGSRFNEPVRSGPRGDLMAEVGRE